MSLNDTARRPAQVSEKQLAENWRRVFGAKISKKKARRRATTYDFAAVPKLIPHDLNRG